MRRYAELPDTFWGFAWQYAAYLLDRLPSGGLIDDTTPFAAMHGRKPDLGHIKIFGSKCYSMDQKAYRKKGCEKSIECRLVGWSEKSNSYRLIPASTWKLIESRDVIIKNLC